MRILPIVASAVEPPEQRGQHQWPVLAASVLLLRSTSEGKEDDGTKAVRLISAEIMVREPLIASSRVDHPWSCPDIAALSSQGTIFPWMTRLL